MDQLPEILLAIQQRIVDEFGMEVVVEHGIFNNKPYGLHVLYGSEHLRVYLRNDTIHMNAGDVDGPNFGPIEDYWPDEDEFPGHAVYWQISLYDHDFWEQIQKAIGSWIKKVNDWRYRAIAEEFDRGRKNSWKIQFRT